jgi:hypothetical protein
MGNINPAYTDRVRYTLYSKSQGSLIIDEPEGWNSDEKELARNEQYFGIVSRFSNSSKFVGSGKEFIQLVYDIEGINAEIQLKREERHPQTDVWTLSYSGYLDLSTWETEGDKISIKFNSGGLEQALKSRESEQVEIDRETSIDGKTIPALNPITVNLEGRKVFLKTKYGVSTIENTVELYRQTNGQTRGQSAPIPLLLETKSHEAAQSPSVEGINDEDSWDRSGAGSPELLFFAVSDMERTFRLKLDLSFYAKVLENDDINFFKFFVRLAKFNGASDYLFKTNQVLFETDDYGKISNKTITISIDQNITVLAGESLGLIVDQNHDGRNGYSSHLRIKLSNIQANLILEENSDFKPSQTKAILAHEFMERLVAINTNKQKAFYSEFLGRKDLGYTNDGVGAFMGLTHGFWVRQFDKFPIPTENPKVENLFKPLTTNIRDAIQSLNAIWNVGIGIERIGYKEIVRMEDKSYFFNNNVTIRLPNQVKNVKRSVAAQYYYSSLEFGSEKGGDYEEVNGLDEYNTKSTYTTVINRIKETYSMISKYRFDSYGLEFARRKPKFLDDTADTKYDSDVFVLDLKKGTSNAYDQRKWQDDFSKEPTGVFDPSSATNLRFSPFNCLLRHSWWFAGGFQKYITDYVRYGSSVANSQLKTKLIGKNEYAENGNIVNSELSKARFFPEWIEFEHIVDFDITQQLDGSSTILGKKIPNFYGLIEFTNERNETEKGFLFSVKPNGKGQWKVLKSNR